ncbi:CoA ester lyase [Actinomadura sp. GC306]|uniref:HpcH/HpaI aldolase/citrate lyase family protein n=1 Tax=Actinomadura sp. GC306 TaxID=2530367 RepID=UPI001045EEBF|nr:CoA ester lyase [Actinomadura sp. GC306]TDC64609.1 CoA ester lyase [Actinomadura sp. GC306]
MTSAFPGPGRLPRSYLYVPGNAPDKLGKALGRGADALIIDLEDAVPPAGKDAARRAVAGWLASGAADGGGELWVRINGGAAGHDDVRALAGLPALTGLVLAKADDAAAVAAVAGLLADLGDVTTLLMPLLETAGAILDVRDIARAPRVHRLQIGEVDLAADAGLDPGPDEAELAFARGMTVMASSAAGLPPPVGPVSRITADPAALAESTERVRRQGFVGRACIHPAQLPVVHEVFTPSAEQVARAEDVVARYEAAAAAGSGVVLDDAGRLIDAAVIRLARRTLATSGLGPIITPK